MKVRTLFILLITSFAAVPSFVSADWRAFAPVFYDTGAELRGFGSYERDENLIGANTLGWDDRFFREKFTLYSKAYVYDPRFLQCALSIGGVLRQEDYSPSLSAPTGWRNSAGLEYDARLYFLPEHPYNVNLFFSRAEPLYKEHTLTLQNDVDTSNGVEFRYRKKPYFMNTRYVSDSISSAIGSTHVNTLSADANYFKEFRNSKLFTLSAAFNHPDFSNSQSFTGSSEQYSLSSLMRNHWLSLDTDLTKLSLNQESPVSGSLGSDQFSFLERLTAELPWNFRSDAHYRYQNNSNTITNTGSAQETLDNTTKEIVMSLTHRLYESLDSTYTFWRSTSASSGGDSRVLSNYAYFNYVKQTPWGVLQSGLSLGRADTESSGQPAAVNEPHSGIRIPGVFTLNEPNLVDPLSVRVFLKSPLPPNDLIQLQENLNYTVLPSGNTFEINIFSLPSQFEIPGTFDFLVSYSLFSNDFTLRTDTFGYRVSFDFFHSLMPYYTYDRARQDLLSGYFPGNLFTNRSETAGISFRRYGFQAVGEYQNSDWPVSPFIGLRLEVRYSGPVTPTTEIQASTEYLRRNYSETETPYFRAAYTDERTSFSGNIRKRLFMRSLLFSAGGSYVRLEGLAIGNAYSWDSSLNWRIAKLDFTLGATSYHSDVRENTGLRFERTRQYYFLNVGRKLF